MATYNFSYSVIATDNDGRAPTPIDNNVTVSGSHTHTPGVVLSPFTSGLGMGGSIDNVIQYVSDGPATYAASSSLSLSFSSTGWNISKSRSPSGMYPPAPGWDPIGAYSGASGTFRTGTDGTVQVSVSWTSSGSGDGNTTSSGTSGWVSLGSAGGSFTVSVPGPQGGEVQEIGTGTLSVSMRYAENNSVTESGSMSTSIDLRSIETW